jgi:signal transduction histidine kinase/CheY-like chemotaxis protein
VLISILVAVLASYTALTLAGRVANAPRKSASWWIAGGAFAMGTGIWSMHFIGMLAFRLPIPLGYDLGITLLSWGLPIAVSALALWQVSQMHISLWRLLVSGTLLGIGINAMHYLGMGAMRMQPGIDYDYGRVALSMFIAIGAAIVSLWIAFRLRHNGPGVGLRRGAAAAVMGAAIAGMHYTGMAAASFPPDSICFASKEGFGPDVLAIMVILATFAVLTVALTISVYDTRLEARSQILALSQATSEERRRLLDRERNARAEVERMSAMKDQFLATLSHELRTPLNAILGWTQLLQLKPYDESGLKQALQTIERNAWMQARLIDDLLDMSRIIAGNIRLDGQPVEPAAIVEAAMETARPAAIAKRIELVAEFDPEVGQVWGDASRLQQVMWNLISNAVKFTPQGGQVRVSLAACDGHAEFTVRDNGIGISEDFLPHVFDRFRQAEGGTTRRYGGLGLGLSIAKQLIELHGGTLEAHSEGKGKGACFIVRLPLHIRIAKQTPNQADETTTDSAFAPFVPANLEGITALVVDDEKDTRTLLERLLQDCGAEVIVASDAMQAMGLLGAHRPDIVVSDIGMPHVDGFELMRRIRNHPDPTLACLPSLALTAFAGNEDAHRALEAGFNAHIRKPVETAEFVGRIAVLARRTEEAVKLPGQEQNSEVGMVSGA